MHEINRVQLTLWSVRAKRILHGYLKYVFWIDNGPVNILFSKFCQVLQFKHRLPRFHSLTQVRWTEQMLRQYESFWFPNDNMLLLLFKVKCELLFWCKIFWQVTIWLIGYARIETVCMIDTCIQTQYDTFINTLFQMEPIPAFFGPGPGFTPKKVFHCFAGQHTESQTHTQYSVSIKPPPQLACFHTVGRKRNFPRHRGGEASLSNHSLISICLPTWPTLPKHHSQLLIMWWAVDSSAPSLHSVVQDMWLKVWWHNHKANQ